MTTAEMITDLSSAIANGRGFRWDAPQASEIGGAVVWAETGFGIYANPHPFAGATYTVVYDDGTEYDLDSTFNNAVDAVRLAESL